MRAIPSLNLADQAQFAAIRNDVEKYLIESQACYQKLVNARSESMASFLGKIIRSLIYLTILVVTARFAGSYIFNLFLMVAGVRFHRHNGACYRQPDTLHIIACRTAPH